VELYLYFYSPNTPSRRGAQLKKITGTTLPLYKLLYNSSRNSAKLILTRISRRIRFGKYGWMDGWIKSHDSSVGIALGYGLDDRGSGIRFPAGAGNFSLHHRVQNCSRAHPASYPALSLGVKRPGREADHSPPSSAEVKE
jgi:hypothetical protein